VWSRWNRTHEPLHAMRFLDFQLCFLRTSQLACMRFCLDTKVLRDKGFMVQALALSPKRPFPQVPSPDSA
jgi:hypothetical protein